MSVISDAAHHAAWRTAGVVFGVSLVLGLLLEQFLSLSFYRTIDPVMRHVVGAPLLVLGTLIVYLGKLELARCQQPSAPGQPTTRLVKSGVFNYSRNPLYVGIAIAFVGLAIATDKPWWLFLTIPTLWAAQWLLVLPEERYLEQRFGEEYRQYKRAVRRWL